MESELAHTLMPWAGWSISFLMGLVNLLLWMKLTKFDNDLRSVKLGLDNLEKKYLEKHADIKDLEIRMGNMENRILEKIAGVQTHLATVATALAVREQLTRAGLEKIIP